MSNNKSLQILRGTDSKTTNLTLLPGQPFYNKTTKQLLIGSGTGTNESTLANSGIRVEKADQLTTARTISLGTGVTGTTTFDGTQNVTIPVTEIKEAYLTWGGTNLAAKISPIDNAMSNTHSANRLAFANPQGMTVEYSRNAGVSWREALDVDDTKTSVMSGLSLGSFAIGGVSTGITTLDKLRITLDAHDLGIYVHAVKLLLNVSTNGATGSHVVVETSTIGAPTTFTPQGDYQVEGWSGWNSIPLTGFAFGGSSTQPSQIKKIRLTFGITGLNSSHPNNLSVSNIQLYSNSYWSTNSNMARTGHLYNYDDQQNAIFPAHITASDFTTSTSFSINNNNYGTPSLNELHKIVNTKTESIETIIANKTVNFHLDTSELNTGLYVSDEGVITSTEWPISNYSKYLITWDGVEYEVWEDLFTRAKFDPTTEFCTTWYDWYCMGNGEKLGAYHPETKNIPFAITRDLLTNKADIYIWATNGSTAATHTITVKKVTNHQVRKLNREYIYNYNNFLYQGKQANSGWIGLNVVDGPSAFAVGDGNYIERDPSVSGTQNQGAFISGGGNKIINSSCAQATGVYNILKGGKFSFIGGYQNKVNQYQASIIAGQGINVDSQLIGYSGNCSAVFGQKNTVISNGVDIVAGYGNRLTGPQKDPNVDSSKIVQGNAVFGANNVCEDLQTTLICGSSNRAVSSGDTSIFGSSITGANNQLIGAFTSVIGGRYNISNYSDTTVFGRWLTADCQHQTALGVLSKFNDQAILKIGNGQIIKKADINLSSEYSKKPYYYTSNGKDWVQIDSSNVSSVISNSGISTVYTKENAFVILKDGRAQVQSAPVDDIDVVRKCDLPIIYDREFAETDWAENTYNKCEHLGKYYLTACSPEKYVIGVRVTGVLPGEDVPTSNDARFYPEVQCNNIYHPSGTFIIFSNVKFRGHVTTTCQN